MRRRDATLASRPKRLSPRRRWVDRTLVNAGQVIVCRTRPTTAEPLVDPTTRRVDQERDQLADLRTRRRDRAGERRDPLAPPRRTPRRLTYRQIATFGVIPGIASRTRGVPGMRRIRPSRTVRPLQVISTAAEGRGFDQGEHQQRPAKERNRSTQPSDDRGPDIHAEDLRSKAASSLS